MSNVNALLKRIDEAFAANEAKVKSFQKQQVEEHHARQKRLEQFTATCERLKGVWGPRLTALVDRFKDRVQVTPQVSPTSREATMAFQSDLARINLKLSASTDREVKNLVLDYRLDLVPVLMQYKQHDRAEFPLESLDDAAVAGWVDDRIVDFVQTYLSLVAHVRFPKFAAAATLEVDRKTYYFISAETRQQYAKERGVK
jgi:hypothetical protein